MHKPGAIIFITVFFLSSCRATEKWQSASLMYFDTVCQLNVYGGAGGVEQAREIVQKTFERIEESFSPGKRRYSQPEVIALYHRAKDVHNASDGCFDITVAPLSSLWGFPSRSYRVPQPEEITAVLPMVGMEKVAVEDGRLILPSGAGLDWGGIAKGYGIDQAVEELKGAGFSRGFVNAGGDLRCWGQNPTGRPWRVGIKHPRRQGFSGILLLSDLSAATTGDYQRFFERDGIRYHHVFDPKTGYPARGRQSVTVIGPETLMCDALSTALFVSRKPENILQNFPDYGAVIIEDSGVLSFLGKRFDFRNR